MNKKAQSGGLIAGLVFGIASLVIGVIIAFVIVSTLTGAGLLEGERVTSNVINETGYVNSTGYTLSHYTDSNVVLDSFAIVSFSDNTSLIIEATNYTFTNGVITNATLNVYDVGNVTYSYTTLTDKEISTNGLSGNFSEGVNNVSEKIPTVLTVAAVVLILSVLVLLVAAWQRMRIGGGSI